jgi:hypothetical protein
MAYKTRDRFSDHCWHNGSGLEVERHLCIHQFPHDQERCRLKLFGGLALCLTLLTAIPALAQSSGTVNPASAFASAYYPAAGDAVSGATPFNGIGFFSTTAPSTAATSTQIQSAIGPQINTVYYASAFPSSCTVGGVAYTTQLDCAFYTVLSNNSGSALGSKLHLGNGIYTTNVGLVEPANGGQVSIEGEGRGGSGNGFGLGGYTVIQASASIPKTATNPNGAVIAHAPILGSGISVPYNLMLSNFVVDPNGNADQAVYITAEKVGYVEHLGVLAGRDSSVLPPFRIGDSPTSQAIGVSTISSDAVTGISIQAGGQYPTAGTFAITSFTGGCGGSGATGTYTVATANGPVTSAAVTAGGAGYFCAPTPNIPAGSSVSAGGYQFPVTDVFVENPKGTGPSSRAVVTVAISGGVPTFTVTSGGTYSYANPTVNWIGFAVGATPCTTMGTLVPTMTMSGSTYSLTSLSGYGFAGCVAGNSNIVTNDQPAATYGIALQSYTDSTYIDLVVGGTGTSACIGELNGSNVYVHEHPIGCNVGVYDPAQNVHFGPELDSDAQYGMQFGSATITTVHGAELVYNSSYPYTSGFFVPTGGSLNLYGNVCPHGASVTGFNLEVASAGPISHGSGVVYPGLVSGGIQCDTLAAVNYSSTVVGSAMYVPVNNATGYVAQFGSGTLSSNYIGLSGARGAYGFDATDGSAFVFGSSLVDFATSHSPGYVSGTPGTGIAAGITAGGALRQLVGSGITAATTIAPTAAVTHVSGTSAISTITPPAGFSTTFGGCIVLIADAAWVTTNTGNIKTSFTATPNMSYSMCYDGTSWFMQPDGSVNTVSVASANGVSGTSSGGTAPILTISLGAITPSSVTTPISQNTATQTTVSCSTSGDAVFSMPEQGTSKKEVDVYENACVGTATWTFPTTFTNMPMVLSQNLAATVTTLSTTTITLTGSTSTGNLEIHGY